MVATHTVKNKTINNHQQDSIEEKLASIKDTFFMIVNAHLIQNQNASPFIYYFFLLLEHFGLLWFILHPGLAIFNSVYFLKEIRFALQILNFQEFLSQTPNFYQTMIGVILAYFLVQIGLVVVSYYAIINKTSGQFSKYIKKIVNFQLIFNVKVLACPIFAVTINIFYCQQASPYRVGLICYDTIHIVFCVLSVIVAFIMLAQTLFFGIFYFIKNPLTSSYLGGVNRYFTLSKGLIKILLPIYFAVDYNQTLGLVYIFLVSALWGFYIFWHRLFSTHSYQQQHFYVEYFMESVVFWMAVNNILSYYIQGSKTSQEMSLIYAFFSAILIAILLMNIEKTAQNKFVQECLQKKVKKQNMQKFIFILINQFLHESTKQAKLIFKVYSKIIIKGIQRYKQISQNLCQAHDLTQTQEVYHFLCILVESFLQQNNSVILKSLKCYLLCYLGQKSYGLHQSLELQEERLGIVEQFMLYQFRINENVFGSEKSEKMSLQFVKYYRFNEQLGYLQQLVEICAQNNAEYWDELCESDPSIAKLSNLATNYNKYYQKITVQYGKVIGVFPQNLYATNLYLNFLLNVAVNTKQSLKTKQKLSGILQQRNRNIKMAETQFNEDEDISIITLNSIGNNLGVILNCNNNIQQSLGFQKIGLIGKNVTKIMPKIYSQLHNNFILKFIRSQTSHLRPSDKIITALNKDSLLVEMKLTVRMMTNTQNQLVIVGFMKKIIKQNEQKSKGLLMFSFNTSEILGISLQFQKLMNYKLSGKQLAQQQVKLASIMPELNLQLLEKQQEIKTVLQVGSVADQDDMDLQITKHIKVSLRSTKLYEGIKIGFMVVNEDRNNDRLTKNEKSTSLAKIKKMMTPQILSILAKPKSNEKLPFTDEFSLSISAQKLTQSNDGLLQQLPMAKKIQQFVKTQQKNKMRGSINIIYILSIVSFLTLSCFIYLTHRTNLKHISKMYLEMNKIGQMPYYVGRMNLLVSLLWSTEKAGPNPNFALWVPRFVSQYDSMKQLFSQVLEITSKYHDNLQYNKINNYTFKYIVAINKQLIVRDLISTNTNLFNSYIASVGVFHYSNITSPELSNNLQVQSYIVRLNGDQIIPAITDNAVTLYRNLIKSTIYEQFHRVAIYKTIFLILSLLSIASVAYIANQINKVNIKAIQLYQKIRLWDINQLSTKCNQFLTMRGIKINRRRTSSLLRIFPIRTLLEIIADPLKQSSFQQNNKKSSKNNSMIIREVLSPDPLLTPGLMTPALNSSVENGFVDNEESLLKGNESEPRVQIYWQQNRKWITIGLISLFVLVICVMTVSMYTLNENRLLINQKTNNLQYIEEIRKNINFISYFSYRIIQNQTDQNIRAILNKYILEFYLYTGQTYSDLGDPQTVLKNVYTYVETIQQWLSKPNISSNNILLANYSDIYDGMLAACNQIGDLIVNLFAPAFDHTVSGNQSMQLIFAIVLFLTNFIILVILDYLYLSPIKRQSVHSINMIRILPAWIFQRNTEAIECLMDN